MDSAAARWKRPWEDSHALPLPQHHHHPDAQQHHQPPQLSSDPVPDDAAPPAPWPPQSRRESAAPPWYLAESPSAGTAAQMLQSQSDATQNNKRRRLLPDQISQSNPHFPPAPADSAGYHGSGEDHDDSARALPSEPGRQQLQPPSPGMASARFDARGYLPVVSSQEERPCCGPACLGPACARRRALINDIVSEVDSLNAGIQRILLRSDSQPPSHSSGVARLGTDQALAFAVDLLRSNVASLRDLTAQPSHLPGDGVDHQPGTTAAAAAEIRDVMKRRFDPNTNTEPPFLPRPPSGDRDPSRTIPLPGPQEDFRRSFQGSRDPLSPRHSPPGAHSISSGNAFTRPPSPTHNHPHTHRMLPSPTSLNIPPPSTIHTLASPSPSLLPQPSSSSAAHSAHLQDLQHQISLKTLALQTLRQEYDALLSKLDRQRTKCAALEKKFEVTDVEINSLTTEKEELEARVVALEQQVDELREQRDDARRREVQTGEQYRSIVEMASRLQGMAAEEKRAWMQEREGLLRALGWDDSRAREQRAEVESGMAYMQSATTPDVAASGLDSSRNLLSANLPGPHTEQASASATSQVIAALRVEVAQLRSRTQALEATIRAIRDQGTAMEEASQAVVEAGKKMREAARGAIGDV